MAYKIANHAKHLLIVELNSGETVHLAPGELSDSIEDVEIDGNEKVAKLLKMNLISTTELIPEKNSEKKPDNS